MVEGEPPQMVTRAKKAAMRNYRPPALAVSPLPPPNPLPVQLSTESYDEDSSAATEDSESECAPAILPVLADPSSPESDEGKFPIFLEMILAQETV